MDTEFLPRTSADLSLELRAIQRRIAEHEGAIRILKTKERNLLIRIGARRNDSTTPPTAA